jgi:hypothetical protein
LAAYVKLVPTAVALDEYVYIDVVDRFPLLLPPPKTPTVELPAAAKLAPLYVKLVPAAVELDEYVYIDVVDK